MQCSGEQQFTYWWLRGASDTWKASFAATLTHYINQVASKLNSAATAPSPVHDSMKLMLSRGSQFTGYPLVCQLHEFWLLMPQSSLPAAVFYQMNADGTVGTQAFSRDSSCPDFSFNASGLQQ